MLRNRKPGTCVYCQAAVAPEAGWVFRPAGMSWHVCCSSERCTKLGRHAETRFAPRELTSDGRVLAPYDPDALPLIRSMPGAWWDAQTKCWRVSLAPEHRPRLLALAAKLRLAVAYELSGEPPTKEQSR